MNINFLLHTMHHFLCFFLSFAIYVSYFPDQLPPNFKTELSLLLKIHRLIEHHDNMIRNWQHFHVESIIFPPCFFSIQVFRFVFGLFGIDLRACILWSVAKLGDAPPKIPQVSSFNPRYFERFQLIGAYNIYIGRIDFIFRIQLALAGCQDILFPNQYRATLSLSFFDFGDFSL